MLPLSVVPAAADLTGFLGRTTTPVNRLAKGLAIGAGLLVVGFEFEYSATDEDILVPTGVAPALKTFMFNGLLQTPVPIARTQFYGTLGGGVYHETLSLLPNDDRTNFGTNVGGGAKITLAGPHPPATRLSDLLVEGHAAAHQCAAGLRGDQSEILTRQKVRR